MLLLLQTGLLLVLLGGGGLLDHRGWEMHPPHPHPHPVLACKRMAGACLQATVRSPSLS